MSYHRDSYHLHVLLDRKMVAELREILPDRGLVSALIRRLLRNYIDTYREMGKGQASKGVLVSTAERTVRNDLLRT